MLDGRPTGRPAATAGRDTESGHSGTGDSTCPDSSAARSRFVQIAPMWIGDLPGFSVILTLYQQFSCRNRMALFCQALLNICHFISMLGHAPCLVPP
jgi:hypothetical protein